MKTYLTILLITFFYFSAATQENLQLKDSILSLFIKTSAMEKNKKGVNHYEDYLTILYSKSSNKFKTLGYVKLLTKYINQKMQNPIAHYSEKGKIIDKKHIYLLFNEIEKKDTVFNINEPNLALIKSKLSKKKINAILKHDDLYKGFKRKPDVEKEKFYQLILGDYFNYYLKNRFSLNDETIEYPKNFHVSIFSRKNDSIKCISLIGNTKSSTLQPWKYLITKTKIKKKGKSIIEKPTFELIKKGINATLSKDISNYKSSLNLNINFALEKILPYNFWNRDYVTSYGIIKDYILWSYGNFEREMLLQKTE